jgi:hypothetical protein
MGRNNNMSFSIRLSKPRNLAATLQAVKTGIERAGGKFAGDENSGTLAAPGDIAGSYTVNANDVTIIVTDKPFVVPQSFVENKIRNLWDKCKVD